MDFRSIIAVAFVAVIGQGTSAQDAVFESFLSSAEKAANKFDYAAAEKFLKLAEREAEGDEGKLGQLWARQGPLAELTFDYVKAEDVYKKSLAQGEKVGEKNLLTH